MSILTAKDRRRIQADYERDFKKYEHLAAAESHGGGRSNQHLSGAAVVRRSRARSRCRTSRRRPIAQIHITDQHESVSNVQFDRPFHLVSRAPRDLYSIYALEQPLAPGRGLDAHVLGGPHDARVSRRERAGGIRLQRHVLRRRLFPAGRLRPGIRTRRSAPPPRREARAAGRDGRRAATRSTRGSISSSAAPTGSRITP